jgi:60 kDa SS-A/Ro ribonucleoprotein
MGRVSKSLSNATNKNLIPQTAPLDDRQVKNDAGGYVYQVSDFDMFKRFLILGTEGGGYYANEKKTIDRNIACIEKCLQQDGKKFVETIVEISDAGRAPKNDYAIFALAKASVSKDLLTRRRAFEALPKVCRIGTHLYMFNQFRSDLEGGWGRLMKTSIGNWFNEKEAGQVAYQVAKYAQRDGWAARDLLRLSHPVPPTAQHEAVYNWIAGEAKENKDGQRVRHLRKFGAEATLPTFLTAVDAIKNIRTTDKANIAQAVNLITEYNLPREVIPTELLNSKDIWNALLQKMPMTATIRNLGKMTSIGLLTPMSEASKIVYNRLNNEEQLQKARIHPINVLIALRTYQQGHGDKGSLTWSADQAILVGLEEAFYKSFKFVEPSGKNTLLGLDVSGSMGSNVLNQPIRSCEVTAVMAMVSLRTEQPTNVHVMGFANTFKDLGLTAKMSLAEAYQKVVMSNFGSTDCSLAFQYAEQNKLPVEVFAVYTDNETFAGRIHPMQALKNYRKSSGIQARLVTVSTYASRSTIADPTDPLCLDVSGFDSAVPQLIADFSAGRI